jgi:hypothetical protein
MDSRFGGELESGLWAFEIMEHSSLDDHADLPVSGYYYGHRLREP